MESYDVLTKDVIKEIRESNEYQDYHSLLKKVMQDNELYDTINEYRKQLFSLQLLDEYDAHQPMAELRLEYETLLENQLVNEFLIAEQKLSKMGREIVSGIIYSLNLDVGFMGQ